MESGAAVADLDGKDIDWSYGAVLANNRGLFATDPKKAQSEHTSQLGDHVNCHFGHGEALPNTG